MGGNELEESQSFRILEDAKGKRTTFEEIEIGIDLGQMEWIFTEEMIDTQCLMDDDFHEWYGIDSPYGGTIAPPQINYRTPRWLFSRKYNVRGLFYKFEFENVNPIKPNTKLTISAKVTGKWIKNDREFVQYDAEAVDEQGNVIFRTRRVHALDYIKRTAPRDGVGIDSGIKKEKI
jgi:hypothetical protein